MEESRKWTSELLQATVRAGRGGEGASACTDFHSTSPSRSPSSPSQYVACLVPLNNRQRGKNNSLDSLISLSALSLPLLPPSLSSVTFNYFPPPPPSPLVPTLPRFSPEITFARPPSPPPVPLHNARYPFEFPRFKVSFASPMLSISTESGPFVHSDPLAWRSPVWTPPRTTLNSCGEPDVAMQREFQFPPSCSLMRDHDTNCRNNAGCRNGGSNKRDPSTVRDDGPWLKPPSGAWTMIIWSVSKLFYYRFITITLCVIIGYTSTILDKEKENLSINWTALYIITISNRWMKRKTTILIWLGQFIRGNYTNKINRWGWKVSWLDLTSILSYRRENGGDESKLIRFAANFGMTRGMNIILLLIFVRQEGENKSKTVNIDIPRFLLILCECWDIYQRGLMSPSLLLAYPRVCTRLHSACTVRARLRIHGISSCCQLRVVASRL